MIWTKQILRNVMASKLRFSYVLGEMLELLDELVKLDFAQALNEWEDVTGCFLVWLTGITGISFPLLPFFGKGAAERWISRLIVWETIFDLHGMKFHRQYLLNGGNYCKKSKIIKSFRLAGYSGHIYWEKLQFIKFEEE